MASAGNGFFAAIDTLMRQVPGAKATIASPRTVQDPLIKRTERAPVDGLPTRLDTLVAELTMSVASRDQMATILPCDADSRSWPSIVAPTRSCLRMSLTVTLYVDPVAALIGMQSAGTELAAVATCVQRYHWSPDAVPVIAAFSVAPTRVGPVTLTGPTSG